MFSLLYFLCNSGAMSLQYVVKCCPYLCYTQWHHWLIFVFKQHFRLYLIARFVGPKWGPSGADRTQVGPMFAPGTLLSGIMKFVYWFGFVGWPTDYRLCSCYHNSHDYLCFNHWLMLHKSSWYQQKENLDFVYLFLNNSFIECGPV